MSNSYTNYTIVNPTTGESLLASVQETREEARDALALVKAEGIPAKIQANEYTLKSIKFIR